jgi:hypothetical protein
MLLSELRLASLGSPQGAVVPIAPSLGREYRNRMVLSELWDDVEVLLDVEVAVVVVVLVLEDVEVYERGKSCQAAGSCCNYFT